MAIKSIGLKEKIEIDLTGPQGNVFFLIRSAEILSRRLGKNFVDIKSRMESDDYENAIRVFDSEFGDFVDLYR